VAVGDLDLDALRSAVEPFGEWSRPGDATGFDADPEWSAGRGMETREKAQSALAMAFPSPGAASRQRYAMTVIGAVLSGLAGRLFDELRERRALAYTVNASPWLRRRAGAMLTYIATSPDREGEARDSMLAELDRLVREPVPDSELQRARSYAAGLVAIRRQRAQSVGSEISAAWIHGTLGEIGDDERCLRSVSAEEVLAVAAAVFVPDQRAEYVVRGTGKSR
jgi:zinc protease